LAIFESSPIFSVNFPIAILLKARLAILIGNLDKLVQNGNIIFCFLESFQEFLKFFKFTVLIQDNSWPCQEKEKKKKVVLCPGMRNLDTSMKISYTF